jgi:enamine deaminase RidA (YjgF/YER057c/UK114 family)
MTTAPPGTTALARIHDLGYTLPELGPGDSKYVAYQRVDSSIYIAGQLPYVNGKLPAQGVLGRDVSVQQAQELARLAALNALAVAAAAVGELDRVRVVQMMVFVASTAEFGDQSTVADAASELLLTVLGDNGRHARTAIGVAGLPRNSPVEIQMVCAATTPDAGQGGLLQ